LNFHQKTNIPLSLVETQTQNYTLSLSVEFVKLTREVYKS